MSHLVFNLGGRHAAVYIPVHYLTSFVRQVLVTLLNMPERLDWKACMLTEEEDKADAEGFKKAFATFEPSL